jgi:hypothetical protein
LATPVDLAAAWRFRRAVWEQAAKGKSGAGRGGADRRKSRQIGFEEAGLEAIRVGSEEKKSHLEIDPSSVAWVFSPDEILSIDGCDCGRHPLPAR